MLRSTSLLKYSRVWFSEMEFIIFSEQLHGYHFYYFSIIVEESEKAARLALITHPIPRDYILKLIFIAFCWNLSSIFSLVWSEVRNGLKSLQIPLFAFCRKLFEFRKYCSRINACWPLENLEKMQQFAPSLLFLSLIRGYDISSQD